MSCSQNTNTTKMFAKYHQTTSNNASAATATFGRRATAM